MNDPYAWAGWILVGSFLVLLGIVAFIVLSVGGLIAQVDAAFAVLS